ncbi:MAG TPA: nodulation protein NfeD [Candidatus Aminicenantes bacterium]|nr:nodulation protein NfeD [Candidatus Aminicenantes bacterium]HRY65345.1 nodulation protein NfeD [Candidatus Aminicenantes bacterium]HRZ72187.1 nodulation protein NfeD [Candidatus Aminicenantes bacterium]
MRAKILVLLSLLGPAFASAEVIKIRVDAPIHPVTAEYIVRSLDAADRAGADLLILTLDTPGGLDTSMREIIERIVNAKTPVAAFVGPSGSRAASAGFLIALSCDVFAMAPGTSTGSAHPVGLSLTGQAMDKTMEEKVTNDAAAYVRSIAGKRGRNVSLAEDAVRKSLSYTEKEALDGGLIDLIASSEEEIAARLDGRTIRRFDGAEARLALAGKPVVARPLTFRQKFLLTIANPNLAYILLMIGLLGLYFEFSHPGAILPGVLGGISLLLAVFAFQILPINYVGLGLIVLAVILFILEIKVQSFGMLAVGGIAAMIIGSLMLIKAPITELRPSLSYVLPVVLAASLIVLFLLTLVFKAHRRRSFSGREGMIGETGTARTDLAPAGKVFVHGELWEAEAGEPVRAGEKVKVVEVLDGLKIRVGKA